MKKKKIVNLALKDKVQRSMKDFIHKETDCINKALIKLKNLTINQTAQKLEVESKLIIDLLNQRGYPNVKMNEILTACQFNSISDYFFSRLKSLKKRDTKQLINEHSNTSPIKPWESSGKLIGVYAKMRKYGLGKIIYIRQKG